MTTTLVGLAVQEQAEALARSLLRFDANMARVATVLNHISAIPGDVKGKPPVEGAAALKSDLSRMALVFIHAMFEDLVRNLQGKAGRGWTFNGKSDLAKAFPRLNVDPDKFADLTPVLCEMAKLRIQTVHYMDVRGAHVEPPPEWRPENKIGIILFLAATRIFYQRYCYEIGLRNAEVMKKQEGSEEMFTILAEVYAMSTRAGGLSTEEADPLYSDAADKLIGVKELLATLQSQQPPKKQKMPQWKRNAAYYVGTAIGRSIRLWKQLRKRKNR